MADTTGKVYGTTANGGSNVSYGTKTYGDVASPTITLSSTSVTDNGFTNSNAAKNFTATFSEIDISNFTVSDIVATNGATVGGFAGPTVVDGVATYSFTVTPTSQGLIQVSVAANQATDFAGNNNTASNTYSFTYDIVAPTVTNVAALSLDGTYHTTDFIQIQITFSEIVNVTGFPTLTLETGDSDGTAVYSTGSGSSTLTFNYTVLSGHNSLDLDYTSTTALSLNGGTIKDRAGNNATLTLPSPGSAGSLRANSQIVIDGVAPTVTSVNSSTADGSYNAGDSISIQVAFSEVVVVVGTPQLILSVGSSYAVDYASGSGTNTLTFNYVVVSGHNSADLDYVDTSSLILNGGTIKDQADNNANLTLPDPGASGSLGANKAIVVDTMDPTVSYVYTTAADGFYNTGDVISIFVEFSETVIVNTTGGTPQLELNTNTTRYATYVSGYRAVR
jgi:hypothetical protein